MTEVNYQIQKDPEAKPIVVHIDNIKQYESIPPRPNWLTNNEAEATQQENVSQNEISSETETHLVPETYNLV